MDFFCSFPRLRIRDCLTQLYAKDITPDDKQELDEALQREVMSWKLFLYLPFTFYTLHLWNFQEDMKGIVKTEHMSLIFIKTGSLRLD